MVSRIFLIMILSTICLSCSEHRFTIYSFQWDKAEYNISAACIYGTNQAEGKISWLVTVTNNDNEDLDIRDIFIDGTSMKNCIEATCKEYNEICSKKDEHYTVKHGQPLKFYIRDETRVPSNIKVVPKCKCQSSYEYTMIKL